MGPKWHPGLLSGGSSTPEHLRKYCCGSHDAANSSTRSTWWYKMAWADGDGVLEGRRMGLAPAFDRLQPTDFKADTFQPWSMLCCSKCRMSVHDGVLPDPPQVCSLLGIPYAVYASCMLLLSDKPAYQF